MTELQVNNNQLYKILYCLCTLPEFSPLKNKLYWFCICTLRNIKIKILNLISIVKQPWFHRSIYKICIYNKKNSQFTT